MTQEEKEILLKYLCMALPYGVVIELDEKFGFNKGTRVLVKELLDLYCVEGIKPYLRTMSSMTEEEKEEMHSLLSPEGTAIYKNDGIALPINHYSEFVPYEFMNRIIQYILEHHFDFMGLIPKNLAIEVTKDNNPYEQNKS